MTSNDTHEIARTQFVRVGDVRFAYRRFGRRGGLPLLFLNYFAANMDDWDPKVTNGFAAEHEVILFDNAGVGSSTGDTPSTVPAMTKDCVDFCRALDLKRFDVVGFSLGGMIAQQLGFEYPRHGPADDPDGDGPAWWRRNDLHRALDRPVGRSSGSAHVRILHSE